MLMIRPNIFLNFLWLGPVVGSYLYQYGGFTLPFITCGSLAAVFAVGLIFSVPEQSFFDTVNNNGRDSNALTLKDVLKVFSMKTTQHL